MAAGTSDWYRTPGFIAMGSSAAMKRSAYIERVRDELALPTAFVSHAAGEVRGIADRALMLDGDRRVGGGNPTPRRATAER